MNNFMGYYQFMMQRSALLKYTLYAALFSFPLSIAFTIACLAIDCSYSIFYQTCPYLTPQYPYQCQDYCCASQGVTSCEGSSDCVLKPQPSTSICVGLLITSWVLYLIFIGSSITFFVMYRKLGPQISEDYTRLSQ